MSCSALGRWLVACLLTISEAQRRDLVETVALNKKKKTRHTPACEDTHRTVQTLQCIRGKKKQYKYCSVSCTDQSFRVFTHQCIVTIVGASPYVMNFNVTINTRDLALGRIVASAICESTPGGIPGVQVMALPHEGAVEIACNVENVQGGPPSSSSYGEEQWSSFTIGRQNFCHAPASLITGALSNGIGELWKELQCVHM
uniref:Zgc:153901 n=1 Tax=Sinocyclocheilus anshuiensis TaxID=1608454 RepID=A0A671K5S3_9TELE